MAPKIEDSSTKVKEFQFHKIPKATKWQNFKKAVYDPDKSEVFGRTKKNWYQLLIFYSIFYTCLAALAAICTAGLLSTLDDKEPKWKLSDSLIGTNPGLGFRPISDETEEGSLIWYNLKEADTTQKWVDLTDKFLQPYRVEQVGQNYQKCDYQIRPMDGKVCTVEVDNTDDFGPCTASSNYMFNSTSPCVFLKLNRIFGWTPEFLTQGQEGMPEDLKMVIAAATLRNESEVWVSCGGEKPFDKERIGGFRYFPSQGFPGFYFPYKNYKNYLSPVIAVQILNVTPNAIVNIECRAWAKNIKYSSRDRERQGSVQFEVLVDS